MLKVIFLIEIHQAQYFTDFFFEVSYFVTTFYNLNLIIFINMVF